MPSIKTPQNMDGRQEKPVPSIKSGKNMDGNPKTNKTTKPTIIWKRF